MSRVCSICNKGKLSGNLVSHSNRKTPRLYAANLQKVKIKKADGSVKAEYVCTRCFHLSFFLQNNKRSSPLSILGAFTQQIFIVCLLRYNICGRRQKIP